MFRPIRPADRDRLTRMFEQLSPTSRYRRFLGVVQSLSDRQLDRLVDVDFVDHVAWGAELVGHPAGALVGVGRWVRSGAHPELAEMALAVIDDYQRRGVGTALLELLTESARALGVSKLEGSVLADNLPMRTLLRTAGARSLGFEGNVVVYRLSVTHSNGPCSTADAPDTMPA